MDDTPKKAREQAKEKEIEQVVEEDTIRGTRGKIYLGERERATDLLEEWFRTGNRSLAVRLLRAEGFSRQQIAAVDAAFREKQKSEKRRAKRGGGQRGGPSPGR